MSRSYFSLPVKSLLENRDAKNLLVYCELVVKGKIVSTNEYFFEPFKNLSLPTAQVKVDAVSIPNGYKLTVTSNKLAKAVYLSSKTAGFFSDNYFDVLPDKPVEIEFRTRVKNPVEEFRGQLQVRSLKDAFSSSEVTVTNK